ncbi:MAG: preprotein translocase subunit YajC [Oscillospiraceae bacterium]|nr:preprotein translocase subunit YajC [Oscillospiraceae bacterium]
MHNFFILLSAADTTAADASTAGSPVSGLMSTVIMIALVVLLGYFLLYRPQKKQEKSVKEMRASLKVGDEISTNGGILGKVLQIKDDFIVIETGADRTKMKLAKWAIRAIEKHVDDEEDEEDE